MRLFKLERGDRMKIKKRPSLLFLGVVLALVSFAATPAKANQTVFLDYEESTCHAGVGNSIIDGVWFNNTVGTVPDNGSVNSIAGYNWGCISSYQLRLFFNNTFCKCLATFYANDSGTVNDPPGPYHFLDLGGPFTEHASG